MKKLLAAAALLPLFFASAAQASEANFGNITGIFGAHNGAVLFYTSGTRTTAPLCQTGGAQRFAIDASTVTGQAAASVLLTAYAMNKRIYVVGSGACSIWGDTETVLFFTMED